MNNWYYDDLSYSWFYGLYHNLFSKKNAYLFHNFFYKNVKYEREQTRRNAELFLNGVSTFLTKVFFPSYSSPRETKTFKIRQTFYNEMV